MNPLKRRKSPPKLLSWKVRLQLKIIRSCVRRGKRKSPEKRRKENPRRDLSLRERRSRLVLPQQMVRPKSHLLPLRFLNPLHLKSRMRRKRKKLKSSLERQLLLLLRKLLAPRRPRLQSLSRFSLLSQCPNLNRNKLRLMLQKYRLRFKDCQFKHRFTHPHKSFHKFLLLQFLSYLLGHLWESLLEFLLLWVELLKAISLHLSSNNSSISRCSCSNKCMLRCSNSYSGNSSNLLLKVVQVQLFLSSNSHKCSQDSKALADSPLSQVLKCLAYLQA